MPVLLMQWILYVGIIAMARLARPNLSKFCYRRIEKSSCAIQTGLRLLTLWFILSAYVLPFFLIPRTVHPLLGWTLYLLGCFALCSIAVNAFLLPMLAVVTPGLGIMGALLVMAFPWYSNGVVRALCVFAYAFCCAPIAWTSLRKIMACLQFEREAFFPSLGDSQSLPGSQKLC